MIKFIGFVAQWITRLTTDQEIPGSTPGRLDIMVLKLFFGTINYHNKLQKQQKHILRIGFEPVTYR